MAPHEPVSLVILAGGRSRRLGIDKTRLRLRPDLPTSLERAAAIGRRLAGEVIVVTGENQVLLPEGARATPDLYPGRSSLAGIASGLEVASYPYALVVGCDMPFLDERLLASMLDEPRDYDVLIPRNEEWQTLHAIYAKACLEPMRRVLASQKPRIVAFFDQVRVRQVDPAVIDCFDPERWSFFNINTPEDLERAKRRVDQISSLAHESG